MTNLNQRINSFFKAQYNIELDDSNTLLMLSGGLDSTGALWQLLQNSEHKVHIHHLYLLNKQKRAEVEQRSVKNILSYISKSYKFKYSESYHEYPFYSYIHNINTETEEVKVTQNFIPDSDIYNFIAGTICLSLPTIKKIAVGRTKSDSGSDMEDRIIRANKMLELFAPNVQKIYPVGHLTKNEIYNMLPEELRNMTWSCRNPINIDENNSKECGKCKTCLELNQIKNGI
jgi:7-cyano-7-deazaguanine synthase in queuosine biosynthesis